MTPPSDIVLQSLSIRPYQPAGTIVGIFKTWDDDQADAHAYTLVDGSEADDNALFDINSDTLLTAVTFDQSLPGPFHVRVRSQDSAGLTTEKSFILQLTPPSFSDDLFSYFSSNPAVSNQSLATFDKETSDYFWIYLHSLAEHGSIIMDAPANTPPDNATNGTASVYLSATEAARIQAAKTAHAIWLDMRSRVPWRLREFSDTDLQTFFDRSKIFNAQSSTVFYFYSVVDYSPTDAYHYALQRSLIKNTVTETIHAVMDDFRSDFLHGSQSFGDPTTAYRLQTALTNYSSTRFRPARISRTGCHSMSRILLGVLRSLNIPGYETTSGAYFLRLHSEAVFPSEQRVLPHGDHIYSATLTATPVDRLMPTFQFFADNADTPPTGGAPYNIALRHEALQGTLYPSPTILRGVGNPALYGYTNAVSFLAGYAGWDRGLTPEELLDSADLLRTQFNQTHTLTIPGETPKGYVLNMPSALNYPTNSRVSLKALPKPGYAFDRWTGDVSPDQIKANPLVFFMDTSKSIEALFLASPVKVGIMAGLSNDIQIRFEALAHWPYRLEYRENLDSGIWLTLTNVPPQQETAEVVYHESAPPKQRYYRVLTLEP